MPKHGGNDYYAMYYNDEGKVNKKRNKGKREKPTSADTLSFLERITIAFKTKYGKKARLIIMSKEMKDMVDSRTQGKKFLRYVKIAVTKKEDLGFRTVYLSELKEEIK